MKIDLQRYWGHFELYHPGELAARIIHGMSNEGQVTLITKEIRNLERSGLLQFLDEICEYHGWQKENITIAFGDHTQTTDKGYKIKCIDTIDLHNFDLSRVQHHAWNREKIYGMFIGRANSTRMHAAYRHINFEYRDNGLTSFHQDIDDWVDPHYLAEYFRETNLRWQDIRSIRPWSDIDVLQQPDLTQQWHNPVWNRVYEKIAVEIVLETADTSDCFGISEKILRPMMYRRPFILIAGRNMIKNVWKQKSPVALHRVDGSEDEFVFDFRFFENVIPLDYDCDEGVHRVDHAFDILHTLIRTKRINSILEKCADDIEHNYNKIKNYIDKLKPLRSAYKNTFERTTWHLK